MKKILLISLAIAQIFSICACSANTKTKAGLQTSNPYTEVKTREEAMELTEIPIDVPESITGFENRAFSVSKELACIDVVYTAADESSRLKIRKVKTGEEVIGDYNEYPDENLLQIGDVSASLKGANGEIKLVTWEHGGYTYAIYSDGIASEAAVELVKQIR